MALQHARLWQAWAGVMGGDARYQEFAERWGSSGFSAYVNVLQARADRALLTASEVGLLRRLHPAA